MKKLFSSILLATMFFIVFSAPSASANIFAYQEDANVTNATGNWTNPSYAYDGNWGTYARCWGFSDYGYHCFLYTEYNKTENSVGADLQIKYSVEDGDVVELNLSVNSSCFDLHKDFIRFKIETEFYYPLVFHGEIYVECECDEGFTVMHYNGSQISGVMFLYEEAIYWNITEAPADVTPPAVTIYSPENTTYCEGTVNLQVSANETIDIWYYDIGAGNVTFTPNTTISPSDGQRHIVIWANDTSGKWGMAEEYFYYIGTPTLSITSPTDTLYTAFPISLQVSSNMPEQNVTWTYRVAFTSAWNSLTPSGTNMVSGDFPAYKDGAKVVIAKAVCDGNTYWDETTFATQVNYDSNYCYQRLPDETFSGCGLSSGNYSIDSLNIQSSDANPRPDGNPYGRLYLSFDYDPFTTLNLDPSSQSAYANITFHYYKPAGSTPKSVFMFSDNDYDDAYMKNQMEIAEACWNTYDDYIKLNVEVYSDTGWENRSTKVYCYTPTGMELMYSSSGAVFAEQGMMWYNNTVSPTVTIYSPENTTYCEGSVNLQVSANKIIDTWYYDLGSGNNTFTPNTTVNLSFGQSYLIAWANDTSDNWGTSDVYFTVNEAATVEAGSNQTICSDGIAALAGSIGGGASSASWSGGGGTYVPNANTLNAEYTPSAAEMAAGTVTLTLTTDDPTGPCSSVNDDVTITIDAIPTVTVHPSNSVVCDWDNTSFSVTATGTSITYQWEQSTDAGVMWNPLLDGEVYSGTTTATLTITGATTAKDNYYYRVLIDAPICEEIHSNAGILTVDVTTVGGSISGGTTPICEGSGTGVMTLSGHTGSILKWQKQLNAGGWIDIANTNPTYSETPSSDGTWEYRAMVKSGACSILYSAIRTIVVNAAPTADAGSDANICSDGSYTVNDAWASNHEGLLWIHNGAGTLTNAMTLTPTYTTVAGDGGTTVTLTLIAAGNAPCTDVVSTMDITVDATPTATISGTTAVCKDSASPDITFTGASGTPPYTFTYTINGGSDQYAVTMVGNSVTVPVPTGTAGTYNYSLVSVMDSSSTACSQSQSGSAVVTVDVIPTANAGADIERIDENPLAPIAMTGATAGGTYSGVVWSGGGGLGSWSQNANPALATFTPSVTGGSFTATLSLTGSGGCSGTDPEDTRNITWGGVIHNVTLISPVDNYNTSDSTPSHQFRVNGTNETYLCTLYYDGTPLDTNTSVLNDTTTTLTVNTSQSDGSYIWWINCSFNPEKESEHRQINIDTIPPAFNGNITTCQELQDISLNLTADYQLMNDIDCYGFQNWTPIGNFAGSLNGNNFTIGNLSVINYGVFENVVSTASKEIKDIKFSNITIDGNETVYVGILAGSVQNINVVNIHVSDSSAYNVSGYLFGTAGYLGGIIGKIDRVKMKHCSVNNVNVSQSQYISSHVGGMVGRVYRSEVINCSAKNGYIVGANRSAIGGLIGLVSSYTYEPSNVTDSHTENMNLDCDSATGWINCGGLIGTIWSPIGFNISHVNNSYTKDITISAIQQSGGGVGGLIGWTTNYPLEVTNSYVEGLNINSTTLIGGLIGASEGNNTITNCSVTDLDLYSNTSVAGGFLGRSYFDTITDSYVQNSDMMVDGMYFGGFIGEISSLTSIDGSYMDNVQLNCTGEYGGTDWTNCGSFIGRIGSGALINNSYIENMEFIASDSTNSNIGIFISNVYGHNNVISNCHIKNVTTITAGDTFGGFISGLNGGNNIISNSYVDNITVTQSTGNMGGFIGWIGEYANTITNCHVSNINVNTTAYSLGGFFGKMWYNSSNQINNSYVQNITVNAGVGVKRVGGFGAVLNNGSLYNCYVDDFTFVDDDTYEGRIGGFLGTVGSWSIPVGDIRIERCRATDIDMTSGSILSGFAATLNSIYVNECFATGTINITNSSSFGSGFADYAINSVINNTYTTVSITGTTAESHAYTWINAGYPEINISHSYTISDMSDTTQTSSFAPNTAHLDENNFYDYEAIGFDNSATGTARTTAEMTQQATYSGWDFANVWTIQEGVTYPYFQWQTENIPYAQAQIPPAFNGNITSCQELQDISLNLTEDYQLLNDIDCSGFENWLPIGNVSEGAYFYGNLYGNGYTIANLSINCPFEFCGIFGGVRGLYYGVNISPVSFFITNLILSNITVVSSFPTNVTEVFVYAGVLAGFTYDASIVNITILDSSVTILNSSNVTGATTNNVGGLIGYSTGINATNIVGHNVNITCNEKCGGLFGFAHGAIIIDSHIDSIITCTKGMYKNTYCGGFIGNLVTSSGYAKSSNITNSYSSGKVDCDAEHCGGFIGLAERGERIYYISGSSSNSTVLCRSGNCGGFAGYIEGGITTNSYSENPTMNCTVGSPICGGFVGKISEGTITDCYSEGGNIYGNPNIYAARLGGFAGRGGELWDSVYDVYIERSWTTTDLEGWTVGGFINDMFGVTINECYSSQNINTTNASQYGDAGGFADWGANYIINNSYTTSNLSGIGELGGFMALLGGWTDHEIYNSYAGGTLVGEISGIGHCGYGFGHGSLSGYSGNYWNSDTIAYNESLKDTTYSTPKTTEEMTQQSTYSEWDFTNVWTIQEGVTYPYFQWQTENIPYAQILPPEKKADLEILSPDIGFSDSNPSEGDTVLISVRVYNNGDENAENVTVQVFDGDELIAEKTISSISHNSYVDTSVEWTAETEDVHVIKVVTDSGDIVDESDEDNNEATRLILVGEVTWLGGIVVTGALSPAEVLPGSLVTVYGNAVYNTTYGAGQPVAGADVTIDVIGDGQWTTHTISSGDYIREITAPYAPGNYTIRVNVTDYTFYEIDTLALTVNEPPSGTDLHPSSLTFTENKPVDGDSVSITVTVRNLGDVDATDVLVRLYDGGQTVSEETVAAISGGSSESVTFSWTASPEGTHTIRAEADPENTITELNEGNNAIQKGIYVYPQEPDLTPTRISFSDNSPLAGETVTITANIKNIGGTGASDVLVRFYHNETGIGEQTIASLSGKDASSDVSIGYVFSEVGCHTVNILVDPEDSIAEYDEDNNGMQATICVILPKPDITLSTWDITFSDYSPTDGDSVTIQASVHNTGDLDAESVLVRFYDGSTEIGSGTIPLISTGSHETLDVSWNATPAGKHWITVKADPENMIDENYENNNDATRSIYVYPLPSEPVPELFLYSEDIEFSNQNPDPDEEFTVYAIIHNNGEGEAQNVSVVFYTVYLEDVEIGSSTAASLPIGGEETVSVNWSASTEGSYVIKVVIDPDYQIVELNKDNNEATRGIIVGAFPDLAISEGVISFSDEEPTEGDVITISATVSNLGREDAHDAVVRFYDGEPATGPQIGLDQTVTVLNGGNSTASVSWNTSGKVGGHEIHVVVDPDDYFLELDEENNHAYKTITVTFIDNDGDGYPADVDCDDNDATVYPGAPEICDGKDNDCDGNVDENNADCGGDTPYCADGQCVECLSDSDCEGSGWYTVGDAYWVDVLPCDREQRQDKEYRAYYCSITDDCQYTIPETGYDVLVYEDNDADDDAVCDAVDKCPDTIPWYAQQELKPNHYDSRNWNIADSYGCTCAQVLYCKPGSNDGEYKFGCSQGTKNIWEAQSEESWALDCQVEGIVTEGVAKFFFENTDSDILLDILDFDSDGDGMLDGEDDMIEDQDPEGDPDHGIPDWHPKSKHRK